jgi:hypothetical protein
MEEIEKMSRGEHLRAEENSQCRERAHEQPESYLDIRKTEKMRETSLALWSEMRPFVEKRTPGPMAVYVR